MIILGSQAQAHLHACMFTIHPVKHFLLFPRTEFKFEQKTQTHI